jgi:hypothetical protein
VAQALAWSSSFPSGIVEVAAIDEGPDGCSAIDLSSPRGDSTRVFVCAPSSLLPIAAGDFVVFELTDSSERTDGAEEPVTRLSTLRLERLDEMYRPELEVLFYDGPTVDPRVAGIEAEVVFQDGCSGSRTSCSAFALPAALEVGELTVLPGDTIDVTARDGRAATLHLGRAELVAVAPPTCDEARSTVGSHVNLVVLFDEVL